MVVVEAFLELEELEIPQVDSHFALACCLIQRAEGVVAQPAQVIRVIEPIFEEGELVEDGRAGRLAEVLEGLARVLGFHHFVRFGQRLQLLGWEAGLQGGDTGADPTFEGLGKTARHLGMLRSCGEAFDEGLQGFSLG